MSYSEALADLVHAAGETDVAVVLEKPQGDAARFCEKVFGPALAAEIARLGYPGNVQIPWTVEYLYVYGLETLAGDQAGYRYDSRTGEPDSLWAADRFVIAEWNGDPVSIGADGSICSSLHGVETWTYVRIAENLPAFFALLAAWLRYFVTARGGNLYDDDFQISEEIRAEIRRDVLGVVAEADRDAALAFLLGE